MTLKAREIIRPGDVNMTFYFNNKNQPEKRMPQQVNKPITDSTVKFTDEPVSTSKNISNQPKKTQVQESQKDVWKEYFKRIRDSAVEKLREWQNELKSYVSRYWYGCAA